MGNSINILDQDITANRRINVGASLATAGQRLANMIIDSIIYTIIVVIFIFMLAGFMNSGLVDLTNETTILMVGLTYFMGLMLIPFLYYVTLEAILGKTIGKFITKTNVVSRTGVKPDFANILGRTLCRMIPFEAFSFLGSRAIGWHDSISDTYVITDNPRYHQEENK